jgi:hypothetical protein
MLVIAAPASIESDDLELASQLSSMARLTLPYYKTATDIQSLIWEANYELEALFSHSIRTCPLTST